MCHNKWFIKFQCTKVLKFKCTKELFTQLTVIRVTKHFLWMGHHKRALRVLEYTQPHCEDDEHERYYTTRHIVFCFLIAPFGSESLNLFSIRNTASLLSLASFVCFYGLCERAWVSRGCDVFISGPETIWMLDEIIQQYVGCVLKRGWGFPHETYGKDWNICDVLV